MRNIWQCDADGVIRSVSASWLHPPVTLRSVCVGLFSVLLVRIEVEEGGLRTRQTIWGSRG